jgi:hypothetical protein
MTSAGTLRTFRWFQLGTAALALAAIGLVALSGLGTMLATSLSQPTVDSQGKVLTVSIAYHSLDPGPLPANGIVVSVSLLDSNGSLLVSSPPQAFSVGALGTASGNLTFVLDFSSVPPDVYAGFMSGTISLTLRVGLSSGMAGLVYANVTSSLALAGVG